jgi:hypothetical protein
MGYPLLLRVRQGFHNKALVYDLLFKAASQTMLTIAADRRHLGASIGITAVLHTWGSALPHHPPLPARRPATWVPSHPPLRPARQLRPQGQLRTPRDLRPDAPTTSCDRKERRKSENPIAHRVRPAGSYIEGYRTPAGARYPSQLRPFPRTSAIPENGPSAYRSIERYLASLERLGLVIKRGPAFG